MTTSKKETAEVPVQVYVTEQERDLLRVRAAQQGLSMSKHTRTLIRRDLEMEATE